MLTRYHHERGSHESLRPEHETCVWMCLLAVMVAVAVLVWHVGLL